MRSAAAPTQIYFVDACAVEPKEQLKYQSGGLGTGAFFKEMSQSTESRRSAPIYASAVRGTSAHGDAGVGTMFSRAVVRCFEGLAAEEIDDQWKVTVNKMNESLPYTLSDEGRSTGRFQSMQPTGLVLQAEIHSLQEPPVVQFAVNLQPDGAIKLVHGSIDNDNGELFRDDIFRQGNPFREDVMAGLYNAKVEVPHDVLPLRTRTKLVKVYPPRGANQPMDVSRHGG
jgi:hypothetical protein